MAEHQEVCSPEGTPAADTYPKKILEYMEGFLISKVITHWVTQRAAPLEFSLCILRVSVDNHILRWLILS